MAVVVSQFGFSNGGGALANMVDGDAASYWFPVPDGLDAYPVPPVSDAGLVLPGYSFPAIQFDFQDQARVPAFQFKVETAATLGRCWLIASDYPATSVADTIHDSSDVVAGGMYSVAQMNGNAPIFTNARYNPIRKRFWRFVFFVQPPAA
jgi:hypothetical protein